METLEKEFEEATAQRVLPGVVLAAASKNGSVNFLRTFGRISPEEDAPSMSPGSTLVLASATKIVTCIAAMQCVEEGLVGLDDDVVKHLPEWKDAMIILGLDKNNGGKPILVKAMHKITLRHLLSHTSGITGLENERVMEYYGAIGHSKATLLRRYFMEDDPEIKSGAHQEILELMGTLPIEPLVFEPGTKWSYGQGVDWAGQLVERLTHLKLEDYCRQKIFEPLGMISSTYRPLEHPHVLANLMTMHSRNKDGKVEQAQSIYPLDPKIDIGGSNLYSSGSDFIKFLTSLTLNDGKLLRPATVNLMFDYRLPDTNELEEFKTDREDIEDSFGEMAPEGMRIDHCLAGQVIMNDLLCGRRSGSVNWSGATSCFWWIDGTAGICGFYGSQIMVMGEQQISRRFFRKFEKALYERNGQNFI